MFEEGNQLSFVQAQALLKDDGIDLNLFKLVEGPILAIINDTLKSVEAKINAQNRKFCMELFGYDFIIDESL